MGKKTTSSFGDQRLERGFYQLLDRMVNRQRVILRQLGVDRNEEIKFGRFVNHAQVSPDKLLSCYWQDRGLDLSQRHVLVIGDSSTLSYDLNAGRETLGFVNRHQTMEGFDVHPSIFVDALDGSCYGLGGIDFILTPLPNEEESIKATNRRRIAFEDKQTYKWFSSAAKAIANVGPAASYTLVGDRDADIYDLMARTRAQGWDFVYRSKTNRSIKASDKKLVKLSDKLALQPVEHTYSIAVGPTDKRTAHQASLELKYTWIDIKQTQTSAKQQTPEQLPLWVVEVKEEPNTVLAGEPPIHWILLTSHPIESLQQAMQVVQWYCWRWTIEQLFRTLKLRGLNIAQAQVRTYHALTNLTTLALLAAIQVMALVNARNGNTNEMSQIWFNQNERECLTKLNGQLQGNTHKLSNPHPPQSLAFACWVIARLGGWSGYQAQRPPGPITIILGLNRFYSIFQGYALLQ